MPGPGVRITLSTNVILLALPNLRHFELCILDGKYEPSFVKPKLGSYSKGPGCLLKLL